MRRNVRDKVIDIVNYIVWGWSGLVTALKLCGLIYWPWWLVLSPMLFGTLFHTVVLILFVLFYCF